MRKFIAITLLLQSLLVFAEFRGEFNLVKNGSWQSAVANSLDLTKLPSNIKWEDTTFPDNALYSKLESAGRKWSYGSPNPDSYFKEDGSLKVSEKLTYWYKIDFDLSASQLDNRISSLYLGGAAFKCGVVVNGKSAGEIMLCALPIRIDVTKFLKVGKNSIAIGVTTREGLLDLKNKIYLAPNSGGTLGVQSPVRLEFKPLVSIDDVFVKTSVRNKNIDFEITLANNSNNAVSVTPNLKVRSERDFNHVTGSFKGSKVTIPAHKTVVVNIKESWMPPILWSTTSPELYVADVNLADSKAVVDNFKRSFGFREFYAQGKDFMLNGKRIVLLRNSHLNPFVSHDFSPNNGMSAIYSRQKVNSIRTHLGTGPEDVFFLSDRSGMLMQPESGYSWKHAFPPAKVDLWLPGVLNYYKAWVKHYRNHPSVVIYSLTNETYWESTSPEDMRTTKKIVDTIRSVDPTRLLSGDGDNSWGGNLDIINIHYPEGQGGTLRKKYTNASLIIPNDYEWLHKNGGTIEAWRTKFVWDRPLVFGEFALGLSNENYTGVVGDEFYNWPRMESRSMGERNDGSYKNSEENPFMEYYKSYIVYLRSMGVAGLNPWSGFFEHVMKPIQVAPLDYHANITGGEDLKRKVVVLNDSSSGQAIQKILYYLYIDGYLYSRGSTPTHVSDGKQWQGTITLATPQTNKPLKARLLVRAIWERGKTDVEMDNFEQEINILPTFNLEKYASKIALIDNKDTFSKQLQSMGLKNLNSDLKDKKLLIIAPDSFDSSMSKMVDEFAESGNTAIILSPKDWSPWRSEFPEQDKKHAATKTWVERPNHPVMEGVSNTMTSFWKEDNLVSVETFARPIQGNITSIMNCGGRFGLVWSPLLEVPLGRGAVVLSSLEFTKNDSGANLILSNLIKYGCERKENQKTVVNILPTSNEELKRTIMLTGAVTQDGIGSDGPILVDVNATIDIKALKEALNAKRVVWLHNFTPETIGKVAELLPKDAKLKAAPKEILGTYPIVKDPLVEGITGYDMGWYTRLYTTSNSIFDNAKSTTKTGDWILDTNFYTGEAVALTAPEFLVKIESNNGTILFDTLAWLNAMNAEPQRATRILSQILSNLDVEFSFESKKMFSYKPVDLRKLTNMAFMDSKANDGVGGWTDDGRTDMRYFLINHAGTGNGEEDGMPVDVETFPEEVVFNEVKFGLIDPAKNSNKSVITLGGTAQTKIKLKEVSIPVNQKADVIWLLHASGWGGNRAQIANYQVVYSDGTKETFSITNNLDIGDWFSAKHYSNCKVAWTGRNLITSSTAIYMMAWENPHADKAIKELNVKVGNALYVLVGVTLATQQEGIVGGVEGTKKSYATFDFTKGEKGSTLKGSSTKPPMQTPEGAVFAKDTAISYTPSKELRDMLKSPFGVKIDLTLKDKSEGFYGGVIELAGTNCRICVNKHSLKLVVEIMDAKTKKRASLSSREPLEMDKRVNFELIADGEKLYLFRDGKLDNVIEYTLPMLDIANITLGKASGKDYFLNGIIHYAELYKIQK